MVGCVRVPSHGSEWGRRRTGTAASITRLGGYRLRLLPGVKGAWGTEGTAAGVYDIRLLRDNPCTSSMEWLMQGLPVAHWQQEKRCPVGAGHDMGPVRVV